jgi:hypothetical protein
MMTEREMLHLIRLIVLLERRAKKAGYRRLARALNDAGYYAGYNLGEMIKTKNV